MALQDSQEIYNAYERLFRNFRDDEGEFKYTNLINRMTRDDNRSLVIDYEDLILMDDMFESDLADTLLVYPQRMLQVGSEVLKEHIRSENPDYYQQVRDEKFFVRFNNLPTEINIRDIRAENVDELRWLEGIIIRTTEIKSIIDEAVFICQENNEHIIQMPLMDGIYTRPQFCSVETCKSKSFQLDQKSSKMVDWQFITLQERPEDLPPGASPKSVPCQLTYDMVNAVRPGDRVVVGGIVRSRPTKSIRKGQLLTFDTWLEVNFVESSTKEDEFTDITPEEEREFLDMARDPKIFDRLLESLAPAIHGMKEVKQASLLMLFAGVDKTFPDGFTTRGQPNVLLVGDPGVAKSQLLRYVQSIAPRGLYTSGKGSSAAGLTAAIIREPETGEITLEAGAMVLADRGVCLAGETEILTDRGELVPIRNIVEQDLKLKVLSFNPETFEIENDLIEVTSLRYSEDVYELEFATGDKLIASKEHPLPTWNNGIIWKTVEEVEKDDVIIDYRDFNFKTTSCDCDTSEMNEGLAEYLGLFAVNGNLARDSSKITFYCRSEELIQRYIDLTSQIFGIDPTISVNARNGMITISFHSEEIHSMLATIGLFGGNKFNQSSLFRHLLHENKSVTKAFLMGVINGDSLISSHNGGIVDICTRNLQTAKFYRKLFRKVGIISRVNHSNEKGHRVAEEWIEYNHKVSITGTENIRKIDDDRLLSGKRVSLRKFVKRSNDTSEIYNIDGLVQRISHHLPLETKRLLMSENKKGTPSRKLGIKRSRLEQILKELNTVKELEESKYLSLLNKIVENNVHFIRLIDKQRAESQIVYNIQIKKNQTYFANFIPVHNCLIDEFDKMNENDRSAIHEAMEQHSYHPSTEITFADGSIQQMGEFVDNLFDKFEDNVVDGVNCEILPLPDEIAVNSTDFNTIYPINIDRISRHLAPEFFYKIEFDNGRSVIVTPNHPMYVYDHGITTLDASEIRKDMFVPAPRVIRYYNPGELLEVNFSGEKEEMNLPSTVTTSLGHLLGYMVSGGISFDRSSSEIRLNNTVPSIAEHMKSVIQTSFNINRLNYCPENSTIHLGTQTLQDYFEYNFPALMGNPSEKRIPHQLFSDPQVVRVAFLQSSFVGDGSVESEACYYYTNSEQLATDYQDLLLTLGVHTSINRERLAQKGATSMYEYKVRICGDSLDRFASLIVRDKTNILQKKYGEKLDLLLTENKKTGQNRHFLPSQVAVIIRDCLDLLHIELDGRLHQYIESPHRIGVDIVEKHLDKIKVRYRELLEITNKDEIGNLRQMTGFSQKHSTDLEEEFRNVEDYHETRQLPSTTQAQLVFHFEEENPSYLKQIKEKIQYLETICSFRWLKVKNIQKIPNKDEYKTDWVYDVTIEPTRSFISQGVILHNTVSVAKAGIVATLNARTGVMAAANPRYGRYEDHRTFNENVNLPPTILSRFDLIFVLRDTPKEDKDSILANHILNLHRFHGSGESVKPALSEDQLKKYIAYAKRNYHPTLSAEAAELIETFYVNMRNRYATAGEGPQDRITITARQLEGIIRLSEARARAALRSEVSKSDAQFAIDLVKHSLRHIATDPETGALDIDAFYSGQTSTRRSKLNKLLSVIDFVYRDVGGKFKEERLIEAAKSEGLSEDYIKGAIRQMLRDGTLYQPRVGYLDKP